MTWPALTGWCRVTWELFRGLRAVAPLAGFLGLACLASAAGAAYYDHTPYLFAWIDSSSHSTVAWTGAGGAASDCTGAFRRWTTTSR